MGMRKLTHAEWIAEATDKFGKDAKQWRFICPSCGHVASVQDWHDAGAPDGAIAFSCIGRYTGSKKEMFDKTGGPCNYAGGGLFGLNPVSVDYEGVETRVFEFAEAPHVA